MTWHRTKPDPVTRLAQSIDDLSLDLLDALKTANFSEKSAREIISCGRQAMLNQVEKLLLERERLHIQSAAHQRMGAKL